MMFLFACALLIFRLSVAFDYPIVYPRHKNTKKDEEIPCQLLLSTSTIPNAGRGIFAGADMDENEVVEHVTTLTVKSSDFAGTQLDYYVFGSNEEEYVLVMFGAGMMYNHHQDSTVTHFWANQNIASPSDQTLLHLPYTNFTNVYFRTTKRVEKGEELFTSYGVNWFTGRDMQDTVQEEEPMEITTQQEEKEEKDRPYICLSDVYVKPSHVVGAGKGLFANRAFAAGELVTVSPVLLLDLDLVIQSSNKSTVLVNYCISDVDGKVCLLPIGSASLMNHRLDSANVALAWFSWDDNDRDSTVSNRLQQPLSELFNLPYAPLDLAYIALMDIAEDEELFLDYGLLWQQAYDAYEKSQRTTTATKELFRHPIYLPNQSNLFPASWYVSTTTQHQQREQQPDQQQSPSQSQHGDL